jgi:hypothetical protein
MKFLFFSLGLALAAIHPSHSVLAGEAIPLGPRRELFVDHYLIDRLEGAQLKLHAPQPREKVLTTDLPWEGIYSGYFTVIQDAPKLRLYYRGMPEPKHDLDTEVTCYAESEDGIRWIKPKLGLFEVRGTRDNNVILARHRACHNFAPFLDKNPDAPAAQRYKALGGTGEPGLIAFVSPDGIHWSELQKEPVISKGAFDSQNVSFWSEHEGQYVCYFRVFKHGVRWISRTTSKDFVHWTDPVEMEPGEQPIQHLYTNQTQPYHRAPHIYLGLPTRFMPGRRALTDAQTKALGTATGFDFRNDCADILLTSTRGGAALNRTFLEAFIRPGLDPRNWTSRANYAVCGIVQSGPEELSLYVNHNLGYPTAHVRRYTLRLDGFVSVNAPFAGGEMTTKPITFAGRRLTLNYSTSAAGSVRVEIQDAQRQPIPGFFLADCPEIIGDQIERVVAWKGGDDLSTLAGQPVRLRFVFQDADLYSIQFFPGGGRELCSLTTSDRVNLGKLTRPPWTVTGCH